MQNINRLEHMPGEISEEIRHFIAESHHFQEWPECNQMLVNLLAKDEPWFHALPILTCKAVGGAQSNAIPVAAAWMTLVHAANLIDDVQDGDIIRSAQLTKPELAITIAVAWIFAAFRMLVDPCLDLETRDRITKIFASAGFDSSTGQFHEFGLNTGNSDPVDQLQAYWKAVILKSGSICMAGAAAGAAAGTDSATLIEAMGDYGTALGVIRQVIDHCRGKFTLFREEQS
jgi:geranylgeranyl pyrophosphate synthase